MPIDDSENIQLRTLIQKRGQLKSTLTRFKTFLESYVRGSNINQIKIRLAKIEECWVEFKDIQSQIELIDFSDTQTQERVLFEDQFFELTSQGQNYIDISTQTLENRHTSAEAVSSTAIQVCLPAINLPSFSGNVEDWISFADTFKSLIHFNTGLNDIQKLHYLRSSLSGDAAKVIHSLESSAANYDVAWHLLEDRYKNRKVIILKHVKSLFDLPMVERDSYTGLRQLLDRTLMHLRALAALDEPTESWNTLLIYLISSKLSPGILREWDLTTEPDKVPKLSELTDFLQRRCQTLENSSSSKPTPKPNVFLPKFKAAQKTCLTTHKDVCKLCSGSHAIFQCQKLLNAQSHEQYQLLREARVCFNCLAPGHTVAQCQCRGCKKCSSRHNTILHPSQNSQPETSSQLRRSKSVTEERGQKFTAHSSTFSHNTAQIILSTAIVDVISPSGQSMKCRALIDNGSQSCFMTEHVAQQLSLRRAKGLYSISGINQTKVNTNGVAEATVRSRISNFRISLSFLIVPRITSELPTEKINIDQFAIPSHVVLADPAFGTPGRIDLLIGQEVFFDLLSIGQIRSRDMPTLQKTRLGWIVGGRFGPTHHMTKTFATCHFTTTDKINKQLEKFWHLEEPPSKTHLTTEERFCDEHYKLNTTRQPDGRYIVKMPLKAPTSVLGDSRELAEKRFFQTERRLARDHDLRTQYQDFMKEYESLGHMELVTATDKNRNNTTDYYLPHHPVIKAGSSTTKVRVVFDASAKTTSGSSLNDLQLVGPTVQNDIFSIILRFRMHKYVLTADLEKMYRQILIAPSQRSLLKILWRNESTQPLQTYQLNTVTYGTASAPYLATRTLLQLAHDERDNFPTAAAVIERDFYVDDLMTGADTIEEARILQQQLIHLLSAGGFNLRKWNANSDELLKYLHSQLRERQPQEMPTEHSENFTVKTLGLWWDAIGDTFHFKHKDESRESTNITKRIMLSEIARLYDPLGLVAPVVIRGKIQLQELWKLQLQWDESLPMHMHTKWRQFQNCLNDLNNLSICRPVTLPTKNGVYELHGFSDASEKAYGGAVYIRHIDNKGSIKVNLLCAKSRVAPLKTTTLPRLELCAAVLLAKLMTQVTNSLQLGDKVASRTLWTDSTVVLSWINAEPASWNTFVANRVSTIQDNTSNGVWKHVRTEDNPADLVSRGTRATTLATSTLWWHGPSWLNQNSIQWPAQTAINSIIEGLPERRRPREAMTLVSTQDIKDSNSIQTLIDRRSSFLKIVCILAYCLLFIQKLRNKSTTSTMTDYIHTAKTIILKHIQRQSFSVEHQRLLDNQTVRKGNMSSLNPFFDKDGVIRVGGRLKESGLNYETKHPVLLPKNHRITEMISHEEHVRQLHCGPQALLYAIRQQYWPINGRELTRKTVHKCIKCFRAKPKLSNQLMSDLPSPRVNPTRAFLHCGVDYCGPFHTRLTRRRGGKTQKSYVAVFICLATKAVHLELVGDLTTESFLGALRRFVARRGLCAEIRSDNGTTFVGAKRELQELYNFLKNECLAIQGASLAEGIKWSFNPPYSPHMGGIWEAAVKSMKHHLRRIVGTASLSFEELTTVVIQIEAVLNSRPITPMSNDPSDLSALTPGHFLVGGSLRSVPEPSLLLLPEQRLSRWQRLQQLQQHFWARWSTEYLTTLQQRSKWKTSSRSLQVGDLVVLREDNTPPLSWHLGRVINTYPGKDGLVRVVHVKTSAGEVERSVVKVCLLPVEG